MSFTVDYDLSGSEILDDVSRLLYAAIVKKPLLGLFRFGSPMAGEETRKVRWPEEVRQEFATTLGVSYVAASNLLQVASTTGIVAGDQISISDHVDSLGRPIVFSVTSVTNATDLAVTVIYGTDTSVALASPAQTASINHSEPDNATAGTGKIIQPSWIENYLQLFQTDKELGNKTRNLINGGLMPGVENAYAQMLLELSEIQAWKLYRAVVNGVKQAESSTVNAKMGGLHQFINTASTQNKVDAGATLLTEQHINDCIEQLAGLGMDGNNTNRAILCHPTQARRISSLRADKVIYTTQTTQDSFGGRVQTYVPDMPGVGAYNIVADWQQPEKVVLLLSVDDIELVPAFGRPFNEVVDSTAPGQDGKKYTARTEMSMKVAQATRYHGVIYNLA